MLTVNRLACSTRGESKGMYIHSISLHNANKAEPTVALKSRLDVTINPKQGLVGMEFLEFKQILR